MTHDQKIALYDCYTTLRAVYKIYGKSNEVIANLCMTSASLLVQEFPEIAMLEAVCSEGERS